jgi:hypothetical protein
MPSSKDLRLLRHEGRPEFGQKGRSCKIDVAYCGNATADLREALSTRWVSDAILIRVCMHVEVRAGSMHLGCRTSEKR